MGVLGMVFGMVLSCGLSLPIPGRVECQASDGGRVKVHLSHGLAIHKHVDGPGGSAGQKVARRIEAQGKKVRWAELFGFGALTHLSCVRVCVWGEGPAANL